MEAVMPPPPFSHPPCMVQVCESTPQKNDCSKGPTELDQHFRVYGEFTSAQERCMTFNWYGLALSLLAYTNWGSGGILLVQMISTFRRGLKRRGGGWVSTLWSTSMKKFHGAVAVGASECNAAFRLLKNFLKTKGILPDNIFQCKKNFFLFFLPVYWSTAVNDQLL
jgi:hypothetical protein